MAGIRRSSGSLEHLVEAASQRQAYNNFRKASVLYRKVVARTPVLSGALRAAWYASYGSPVYVYTDLNKRQVTVPIMAPAFPLQYDRKKAWHIFITNGAPYAQRVEDGWSDKAPQGMLRISVMEVFGGRSG